MDAEQIAVNFVKAKKPDWEVEVAAVKRKGGGWIVKGSVSKRGGNSDSNWPYAGACPTRLQRPRGDPRHGRVEDCLLEVRTSRGPFLGAGSPRSKLVHRRLD